MKSEASGIIEPFHTSVVEEYTVRSLAKEHEDCLKLLVSTY
jgi:hypothetical protein